jgi:hypothetical protein
MSEERLGSQEKLLRDWLPTLVLKFLVFLAFAFVLYEATVGLGEQELGPDRAWVVIAGMFGLLLLLAVDRLQELRIGPKGVEATLTQVQAEALQEIGAMEDREMAGMAQAQILQAQSADQVQKALSTAVELNVTHVVERVKEAIHLKRKLYVRYRPDPKAPLEAYQVAPLDIKPGKTAATQVNDYLWVHSYEHGSTLSLRLERVLGVELSEETFDPAEVMADWKNKSPEWNVPREW